MVVLGKIVEPYGIAGWVRVHPFADDWSALQGLKSWWLAANDQADAANWRQHGLLRARVASDKLVAQLDGVVDRTAAENLKGWYVAAPREALPAPGTDEYYWDDLIGLEVRNQQQEVLGKVREMLATGANDVMVVKDGERQRLIPFLGHVVQQVDLAQGTISVDWGADW